jgi:hypothetical protein
MERDDCIADYTSMTVFQAMLALIVEYLATTLPSHQLLRYTNQHSL